MNNILEHKLRAKILQTTAANFEETALEVFNFQYTNNEFYKAYCNLLHINSSKINCIEKIPFLPIQFFKTQVIKTTTFNEQIIFESSGTTGSTNSKHFVKEKKLYEESYLKTFRNFYGSENNYCIIGLLPSYLERQNSSLVYMVDDLIKKSEHKNSGFYLYDYEKLKKILLENEATKQPTLLIGVTYALVDFAELNKINLQHTTIIETGGMKGRRDELSRKEVHQILTQNLAVQNIHSEYGMTELLSQAYSTGNGFFTTPTYMQILLRSKDDPFEIYSKVHTVQNTLAGGVNIIDLANLYSCAFIATDDAGILYPNNSFEIIGRLENCDIRGCSLMVAE